mmetsp:Transcript_15193/g.21325  ORF Transcript_15193/g.21325 Transcript_15193/m.21325 type:complete len:98 (-) Transcript_15193:104-397(-)
MRTHRKCSPILDLTAKHQIGKKYGHEALMAPTLNSGDKAARKIQVRSKGHLKSQDEASRPEESELWTNALGTPGSAPTGVVRAPYAQCQVIQTMIMA